MQDLPTGPSNPTQLQMAKMRFDAKQLRGLSLQERQQLVARLAIFLAKAAGTAEVEGIDGGR